MSYDFYGIFKHEVMFRPTISLQQYQILFFFFGKWLKKSITFFETWCASAYVFVSPIWGEKKKFSIQIFSSSIFFS